MAVFIVKLAVLPYCLFIFIMIKHISASIIEPEADVGVRI